MSETIDGKSIAAELSAEIAADVERFVDETGAVPTLAVVLVGEDPASQVYVKRKLVQTRKVGMRSIEHRLAAETSEEALLALIKALNADRAVHGILVQLPLPPQINAARVLGAIDPNKDVDGFHPVNVGRLSTGTGGLVPCTPLGCMMLLDRVIDDFRGLKAVVVGKSNIVGKPVALLLLERECTVTVTHILTRNLPDIVRSADIVVVAAGSPGLVRGDWVKPGAVVIDVGINRIVDAEGNAHLVGDVVFADMGHARAVTPVPGGVGPMTIACLLANTMKAARKLTCRDLGGGHAGPAAPVAAAESTMKLSEVIVRDLSVAADIGVHAHEIGRPQRLVVNATLRVRPSLLDRLEETVDYTDIVAAAQSLANERIVLIESFAYRLAAACLRRPGVEEADILIEKPGALVSGLACARVVLGQPALTSLAQSA